MHREVYTRYEDIPMGRYKDQLDDVFTPLKNGKKWLYEETLKYQPKTGKLFNEGSNLALVTQGKRLYLLQKINNIFYKIERNLFKRNLDDKDYKQRKLILYPPIIEKMKKNEKLDILDTTIRVNSLPFEIMRAYYYRFDGFRPVSRKNIIGGSKSCFLPISSNMWDSMGSYLDSIGKRDRYSDWLNEYFPGKMLEHPNMLKDDLWLGLMCFLDTRCVERDVERYDMLFVKTVIQDKVIYFVRDGDIQNMRILSNYKEALDDYCSHCLLQKGGSFDFLPYTSEFIDPKTQHSKEIYEITQDEIDWWKNR